MSDQPVTSMTSSVAQRPTSPRLPGHARAGRSSRRPRDYMARRICEGCGRDFTAPASRTRCYCSRACAQEANPFHHWNHWLGSHQVIGSPGSWWVGLTRAEFMVVAPLQAERMRQATLKARSAPDVDGDQRMRRSVIVLSPSQQWAARRAERALVIGGEYAVADTESEE